MRPSFRIAALALTALPAAAIAHHGWSSYDATRTITLTAPLTDVAWRNPHGTARVAYRNQQWDVVLAPVARMEARGLTREMVAPGNRVTLVGYPRRDGTREMRIERVIVGRTTVELR
ncbi:DUF6152 family protein [Sphingosinicella sp. LHD-64]|uniref:DUF6152 family protein n=1 Tax=Sphingosinicella sp. LHD-64 TaxID=3072139 RepID=UPI00280D06A6|nr:DUF6152 family protein [Sphingosinicella sp. LHD-64]MDQ8756711.1 DUF6152 family protein [Sphingosinicella sp. LHD-64]